MNDTVTKAHANATRDVAPALPFRLMQRVAVTDGKYQVKAYVFDIFRPESAEHAERYIREQLGAVRKILESGQSAQRFADAQTIPAVAFLWGFPNASEGFDRGIDFDVFREKEGPRGNSMVHSISIINGKSEDVGQEGAACALERELSYRETDLRRKAQPDEWMREWPGRPVRLKLAKPTYLRREETPTAA